MFSHEVNTECDINSDFFEWQWKRWTFPVSSQLSHQNRWQQCHFAKPHICWTFKFFPLQLYISTFSVLFCEDTVHISWLGLGTKISSSCKKEYIYIWLVATSMAENILRQKYPVLSHLHVLLSWYVTCDVIRETSIWWVVSGLQKFKLLTFYPGDSPAASLSNDSLHFLALNIMSLLNPARRWNKHEQQGRKWNTPEVCVPE